MPINNPSGPQTAYRSPRLAVFADGKYLPGASYAEVQSNNYYQCDHFSVEFAINAGKPGWWDVEPPLIFDIRFALTEGGDWVSLIIGEVDHMHPHLQTGLISMEGRDLSARLIEAKTQESYLNKTSSEIAEILGARHDLKVQATKTSTLVHRFYEGDHTRLRMDQFSHATTEWDLLVSLAQHEGLAKDGGFDVFVKGQTLYFQPRTPPDTDPFVLIWTPPGPVPRLNAVTLHLERSLTLAKDIEVKVRSWNSQQGRGFTKIAKAVGTRAGAASAAGKTAPAQTYAVFQPNMTEDGALKLAQQLASDYSKHERVADVEMPGELTLTPRTMVRLQGTGTSFDTTYYIDHIHRSLSFDGGFRQNLRLKNSSPRSEVIIQ